jgi:hypothetical protein
MKLRRNNLLLLFSLQYQHRPRRIQRQGVCDVAVGKVIKKAVFAGQRNDHLGVVLIGKIKNAFYRVFIFGMVNFIVVSG